MLAVRLISKCHHVPALKKGVNKRMINQLENVFKYFEVKLYLTIEKIHSCKLEYVIIKYDYNQCNTKLNQISNN